MTREYACVMTQTEAAPKQIVDASEILERKILLNLTKMPHPLPASWKELLMAVQQFNFEQRGIQ